MFDIAIKEVEGADFFDFLQVGNHLAEGDVLETAVIASLFCDARARVDDDLPFGIASRRGYWGDSVTDRTGDIWGSRLWLLSREKQTAETLARAQRYAREALDWMIQDGIAEAVAVAASWVPGRPATPTLFLDIQITIRAGDRISFQYRYSWLERVAI